MAAMLVVALVVGIVVLKPGKDSPGADGTPTPSPLDPKAQVEQAYLEFWKIWTDANLNLDASNLDRVATGDALDSLKKAIEDQRAKNQPGQIRVEHNYTIAITGESTASVDDTYINHSRRLDPQTKEPIEPDPNNQVHKSHTLKKVGGIWKVAEIIEYK